MEKFDCVVIGGGAAGMFAAITAAENKSVCIIEHMDCLGKKILLTGNGKCNFTNGDLDTKHYYCSDNDFIHSVLKQFRFEDSIHFFESLGIYPIKKHGEYYYPNSGKASDIRRALELKLDELNVDIKYSTNVRNIIPEKGFRILTDKGEIYSDYIILATGGKSYSKTGSDGCGYQLATRLGHSLTKTVPGLVPLQALEKDILKLHGIRIDGRASLYIDDQFIASDFGEIQFSKEFVSGIPIFQISHYASLALADHRKVQIRINLLPDYNQLNQVLKYLTNRLLDRFYQRNLLDALLGLFPDHLSMVLIKRANLPQDILCQDLAFDDIKALAKNIFEFTLNICATKGFDFAQVTIGGINTAEIDATTMMSKLVPNLYFAGEMLDIDGICGGYNLHFAFGSGYIAGLLNEYDQVKSN